jgi:hypothetical protein
MKSRITLLLSVVFLFSCTSIYQRRGTEAPLRLNPPIEVTDLEGDSEKATLRQLDWESRSVEKFRNFELGVIEVGDDGLTNPAQVEQVMDMVRERATDEKKGLLLVVFAHGWHHGPSVCDRDLCCFRRVLDSLSRMEGIDGNVNVTGIYLGWRGESIKKTPWNNFTFWNRKSTAQHVGGSGAKEVLLQLDELYREVKNREENYDTKYVKMVTVGHSFGGALVFNIMKRLATGDVAEVLDPAKHSFRVVRAEGDRVEAFNRGEKAIRARLGDLVVLVNPAIEASQYDPFDNDLPDTSYPSFVAPDKSLPYSSKQLPVLITVASQADKAVGVAFPAGRWASAIIHPSIAKKSSRRIGMGHYEPHITHTLDYTGDKVPDAEKVECSCTKNFFTEDLNQKDEPRLKLYTREDQTFADGKIKFGLAPRHAKTWDVHSPFLVISTTGRVIAEHSDIYNPVFVSFLQKYIQAYVIQSVVSQAAAGK